MKTEDDGAVAADIDQVDRRWTNQYVAASGVSQLSVLRQFISRFTETRVRSELAERHRGVPRPSLFLPHDSLRLRIPTYRKVRGGTNSDVSRPLESGRVEKILKSIIVQTISDKLFRSPRLKFAWETDGKDAGSAGLSLEDVARATMGDVMDSRSSSSDDGGSGGAPAVTEEVGGERGGSTGRKTRPKRGHYRKYNRQLLLDAVRAVQKGDMSVHRAGSYYGVPHSTLEYKVKERHLLRQRKTESSGTGLPRSRRHDDQEGYPRSSRGRAPPDAEHGSRIRVEPSSERYLPQLRSQWPYPLSDTSTSDSISPWQRLFHSDSIASGFPALPPLLPFDIGRTLPVGFGWPPPPPLLAGIFPDAGSTSLGVDSSRLAVLRSTTHPFSMSASDLLKSFQRKAAASGGGNDVREMADDRLMSLFPVLGGSGYGVGGHTEDGGSSSQVAVG